MRSSDPRPISTRAVEIGRQLGDPRLLGYALNGLGGLLLMLGQPLRARELAEEALPLAESTGDRSDLACIWRVVGRGGHRAWRAGQGAHAAGEKCRAVAGDGPHCQLWPVCMSWLGRAALSAGELLEAETEFRTALAVAARYEKPVVALSALAGLAAVSARKGDAEAAVALVTFVLRHPCSAAETRRRAEKLRTELEAQLTPEQIQAAERRAASREPGGVGAEASGRLACRPRLAAPHRALGALHEPGIGRSPDVRGLWPGAV